MPISPKYQKTLSAMIKQYGPEKGKSVFYAKMKKDGIDYTKENSDPNILENQEIKWTEKLEIKEKDTKKGRVRIGGTALKETTSSNNRKYTIDEIEKNKDKEMRYFVDHIHEKGAVGKLKLSFEEKEKILIHDGWIKNTHAHPDIVENVSDGLYDVSIGGNGTLIREKDTFRVKNLDIREVSLVGIGGVEGAGIDYAIAESFKAHKPDKLIKEVDTMVEEDKNKKISEKLEKENKELKEKMEAMEKAKKEELVESVLKLNEKLDKKELMEKPDSELMLIKEYEGKLKEEEDKKEDPDKEGEKDKEGEEGNAEVEPDKKEEEDKEEKTEEGIVIDKRTGNITMSEKLYNKFNKEIKESIYR